MPTTRNTNLVHSCIAAPLSWGTAMGKQLAIKYKKFLQNYFFYVKFITINMGEKTLKKLIYIIGIIFLAIITILNFIFTAKLDSSEHIIINFNNPIYILGLIIVGILIFIITNLINKHLENNTNYKLKNKIKKYVLIIYAIINLIWIITIMPPIVGDQGHVCDLAETFSSGDTEKYLPKPSYAGITMSEYMEKYQQQIPLAFLYSLVFRLIFSPQRGAIRVLNVIFNSLIVIGIYKINQQLSKKYKTNKVLLFTLALTFLSIPMLSTFVYGDLPSLAMCLFSIYYMMKYTETKSKKYAIYASILTMIAYMMRMNTLIFIIATVIYLLLNLFQQIKEKSWKEKLIEMAIIVTYIVMSMLPSMMIQNYYLNKYNLDKTKSYPSISFILMAMEEGPRGNGWYNEKIAEPVLKDTENIKEEYYTKVKDRITYFSENLGYAFEFYTMKIASMWTENTYSAINNNTIGSYEFLDNLRCPLTFYQKVLLLIMCVAIVIILIQNRKKLSIDIIFLITIFIGGFAFHILWEAKSRYIIPYIVVLIPIASIKIKSNLHFFK